MNDRKKKPLGQILIEAGIVSIGQIETALQEQKYNPNLRIGEILVLHGWIAEQTVDFFVERLPVLAEEKEKKPLAHYFQEAGLLDSQQINAILRLQKFKQHKVRFHDLAVEQGYLKRKTVDFFIAYLLNPQKSRPLTKIYTMLQRYADGEKNFQKIQLRKAPLMGVSLQGVRFDRSNFQQADLSRANLSHSYLNEADLTETNFAKAILTGVNFTKACLIGTNFRDAKLEGANLQFAILHEADFRGARLEKANFAGAELKTALLPLHYGYEVYYDARTSFDRNFDPNFMGWKIKEQ